MLTIINTRSMGYHETGYFEEKAEQVNALDSGLFKLLINKTAMYKACCELGACKLHHMIQEAYDTTESEEIELLCVELMEVLKEVAKSAHYFGYTLDFKLV